jgi:malonyl-CoA O-methyltransferase
MFSCFGPDTLRELREHLPVALGWPAPAHEFTDMHDWGDMLAQAGFAEPVMDMERITLTFPTPAAAPAGTARARAATCTRGALPGPARARLAGSNCIESLAAGLGGSGTGGPLSLSFRDQLWPRLQAGASLARLQAESQVSLEEMRLHVAPAQKESAKSLRNIKGTCLDVG